MLRYKCDIIAELKKAGYTTSRLRSEKLLAESTLTRLRKKSLGISIETLGKICELLRCDIGDVIEIVPDDEEQAAVEPVQPN